MRSNAEKIKQTAIRGMTSSTAMSLRTRPKETEKIEQFFSIRTQDQINKKNQEKFFLRSSRSHLLYIMTLKYRVSKFCKSYSLYFS